MPSQLFSLLFLSQRENEIKIPCPLFIVNKELQEDGKTNKRTNEHLDNQRDRQKVGKTLITKKDCAEIDKNL